MHHISYRVGYWSAVALIIAFAAWIVSFAAIAFTQSVFRWTDMSDYIARVQDGHRFFQHLAYFFMLLAGPLYLLLLNGYHDLVPPGKRVLLRIGIQFALAYAILSSLHYFVQMGMVRLRIDTGAFGGLEMFLQANPLSFTNAMVMLGWSFFLGFSSLFVFPIFRGEVSGAGDTESGPGGTERSGRRGKTPGRLLGAAFLVNGISCLLACIGYLFRIDILTFLCANLITGGAMMVIAVASAVLFRNQGRVPAAN
jgi:hypothetical protein